MERSEPALVPEWLRCTGSVTGSSSSVHHFVSSSLHSDVSSSFSTRNRCSRSSSDKDTQRPPYLDRSFSSNSRRSSGSNGSAKHPYSSFTRSNRDRNREKDKERFITGDSWDRDSSESLESITSSVEQSSLRRSQSLAPRRNVDVLPRKSEDTRNVATGNQHTGNGLVLGGSNLSGMQKAAFDKDFPSLGSEEKLGGYSIGRVSSPVLSTAVQSLPIGNSGLLSGEKWTSALVEVPPTIGGNNNTTVISSAHQSANSSLTAASSVMTGLNMAEALSQAPSHARAVPQVPDKSQRLDELTTKLCLKLRPLAPTMPKPLIPSVSEKLKQPKSGVRVNEPTFALRSMQQQSHQLVGQPRSGQVRSDVANTAHAGMYIIHKPRENGAISSAKDVSNPTNNVNGKMVNGQHALAPLTPSAFTSPSNPKAPTLEKKVAILNLNHKPIAEKKSALSQAQSRSDFFNLMRKKTLPNSSSNASESGPAVDNSSCSEKSDENRKEADSTPMSPCVTEFKQMLTNGDSHGTHDNAAQGFSDIEEKNMLNGEVSLDEEPDEEEAAFLRSLGWNENGKAEIITEEEINAFYEEYVKMKPSLKAFRGIQPKSTTLSGSQSSNSVAAASESGSTTSESEA